MIDVWGVLHSALWILGLAIGLATWSYARWWAIRHEVRLRETVNMPKFVVPFCAGLALFSLGLALSGRRWWESAAWACLVLLSAAQGTYSWVTRPRTDQPGCGSPQQDGEAR